MGTKLHPYLMFTGNAQEAMKFYQKVLGGELSVTTYREYGDEDPAKANQVMHSELVSDDIVLMAADVPETDQITMGSNMVAALIGSDSLQLHQYWEKLVDGAKTTVPLAKQVWGDEYGECIDKFGVRWMINISQDDSLVAKLLSSGGPPIALLPGELSGVVACDGLWLLFGGRSGRPSVAKA